MIAEDGVVADCYAIAPHGTWHINSDVTPGNVKVLDVYIRCAVDGNRIVIDRATIDQSDGPGRGKIMSQHVDVRNSLVVNRHFVEQSGIETVAGAGRLPKII